MFNEVLKFGAQIVDALKAYKQVLFFFSFPSFFLLSLPPFFYLFSSAPFTSNVSLLPSRYSSIFHHMRNSEEEPGLSLIHLLILI